MITNHVYSTWQMSDSQIIGNGQIKMVHNNFLDDVNMKLLLLILCRYMLS